MKNSIHNSNGKINALSAIHSIEKKSLISVKENKSPNKRIFYKLIHPDYILFDWEYFSRELEFE